MASSSITSKQDTTRTRQIRSGTDFLTYASAAQITGLSEATLIRRVKDGTLRSIMLGRRRLIPRVGLEQLLGIAPEVQ
jgi:excisionase family DNA binding protein